MVNVLPARGNAFLVFRYRFADDFLPLNKLLISGFNHLIIGSLRAKPAKQKTAIVCKRNSFFEKNKKFKFHS